MDFASTETLETTLPIASVLASGIVAGFFTAVTFLDVRTFSSLMAKKDAETIKKIFPIWWPFGKSFMVSLVSEAKKMWFQVTKAWPSRVGRSDFYFILCNFFFAIARSPAGSRGPSFHGS